jgi:hydroxylamine dehydrogenase
VEATMNVTTSIGLVLGLLLTAPALAETCLECHKKVTPGVVSDWKLSKHSKEDVT